MSHHLRLIISSGLLAATSFAASLTGTALNKTTNKPAAGDEVVLLKLAEGMAEVSRTKTDANGRFTLPMPDENASHLVRVTHQGVNYFRTAPPGTTSVEVEVYDAAEKIAGVKQALDITRVEAEGGTMRILQFYAVENNSQPPRTQMGKRSFEILLPESAQIQEAMAAGPGGMPVTSAPVPTGEKGHYAFIFPIKPGESRFQVNYTIPYSGTASFDPKILQPTDSFAISVPPGITLTPAPDSRLERKGEEAGMTVWVAQGATPGQNFAFSISGTGRAPQDQSPQAGAEQGEGSQGRPGGGLGTPINTPDPLAKYQWWIIGAVAIVMVAGAGFMMSRQPMVAATPLDKRSVLQEAIKEELFKIESDRIAKKTGEEEYAKAKSGLEALMRRLH